MKKVTIKIALMICFVLGLSANSFGHDVFQDVLKETYTLKSFSCKTCHPNSDDRKIRSMFAELIYQELKDKNYSEKFAAAEAKGEEAVKEFEKVIGKDFAKAWVNVGKKQMTIDELFKAGLFNGARLDTKKLAAKAAEAAEAGEGK